MNIGCEIFTFYSIYVPTYTVTVYLKIKLKILHMKASLVIVVAGLFKGLVSQDFVKNSLLIYIRV